METLAWRDAVLNIVSLNKEKCSVTLKVHQFLEMAKLSKQRKYIILHLLYSAFFSPDTENLQLLPDSPDLVINTTRPAE